MVSDEVVINLRVDDSDVDAKMNTATQKLDAFTREAKEKMAETRRQMNELGRGINFGIRFARNFARAIGKTIDPTVDAILTLISSSVTSMISIAVAFTTGTLGLGAAAGAIMAAAAIGLNAGATAAVLQDAQRSREQIDGVIAMLGDLGYVSVRGGF